jgi:hypothetical protein
MPVADTTNRRPILLGLAASAALTVLVVAGSRNLEHYDPALFGYTVASVVAFGALVYRYAVWLRRPATRVYWRRGWQLMRVRRRLAKNAGNAVTTVAHNIVGQRFIARRGASRSSFRRRPSRSLSPCGGSSRRSRRPSRKSISSRRRVRVC